MGEQTSGQQWYFCRCFQSNAELQIKNKVSGDKQIILFIRDYILCGIFPNRLKGSARGDGKEELFSFFSFPSPLALPQVTLLVTGQNGVVNIRSGARYSKIPIINGQTRKVVRDTLSTK